MYGTELLSSWPANEPVFVVEGERATDALLGLGLCAMGTVTGASGAPGPDVLTVLADRAAEFRERMMRP